MIDQGTKNPSEKIPSQTADDFFLHNQRINGTEFCVLNFPAGLDEQRERL
jgi:hypothetical protein